MRHLMLHLISMLLDTIRMSRTQLNSIRRRKILKITSRGSRNSITKQKKKRGSSSLVSMSYQIGILKKSLRFLHFNRSLTGLIRETPHSLLLSEDSFQFLTIQLIGEIMEQFQQLKISGHADLVILLQLLEQ
jgi:hypothetical protein